ncbi:hypothetical protein [Microvirga sp. TS319]|uniref:hypothetical protein n=1 Tax=Microvirga sp. TS319 TaxID=3241165 RepID=UPI00351A4270
MLWEGLDRVVRDTARSRVDLTRIDLASCHAVIRLEQELEGPPVPPKIAARYGKFITGCYRARDFVDADTFATALVATLVQHPEAVVSMASDPIHGIPRKFKFVPAISEVADELEAITARIRLAAQGARRALAVGAVHPKGGAENDLGPSSPRSMRCVEEDA